MKFTTKRIFSICGGLITLAALFFVLGKIANYSQELDFSRFVAKDWRIGFFLSLFYAGLNFFLAGAWFWILRFLCGEMSFPWSLKIYGLSQIGKYIPGNIFQFAGRQALGMADGISGRSLARSTVWEIVLLCSLSVLFCLLICPLWVDDISNIISVLAFSVSAYLVILVCKFQFGSEISKAAMLHIFFLLGSGFAFVVLTRWISPSLDNTDISHSIIMGTYILAWLAGLMMPGAPAGIGVRETVLVLLLGSYMIEADLLMAVLIGRIVTVFGDVIFFLAISIYGAIATSSKKKLEGKR